MGYALGPAGTPSPGAAFCRTERGSCRRPNRVRVLCERQRRNKEDTEDTPCSVALMGRLFAKREEKPIVAALRTTDESTSSLWVGRRLM